MAASEKARVWQAIEVVAEAELAEAVGAFLLGRGAPGLQTEERGADVVVTAHFEAPVDDRDLGGFFDALAEIFPGTARPTVRTSVIEEAQWAENWKQHFPTLAIGERLFVHPPWVADIPAGRVAVELDPGMAFGTGQHGSTRGCLAALEELVTPAAAPRVLDLGTGSGILAIAAAALGARHVLAIDIDPLACEIAAANAATNRVAARVDVAQHLDPDAGDFDIVVANLFSGMLIGFANDIARRLRPGGHAVGAGLVTAEAPGVIDAWTEAGLERLREHEVEDWVTLVFRARGSGVGRQGR